VAAASQVFSHRLQKSVSESTVRSIRDLYCEEWKKRRYLNTEEPIETLKHKKKGWKVLLGEDFDNKVQLYLTAVQNSEGGVSACLALAVGFNVGHELRDSSTVWWICKHYKTLG